MIENVKLRTNWIITIEKLINRFKLADKIGNHKKFKKLTKTMVNETYSKFWAESIKNTISPKLELYKEIKRDFKFENYTELLNYDNRKNITKIRCSDHCLEIEKGRHRNIPRNDKFRKVCDKNEVETEEHFLLKCELYKHFRNKYNMGLNMTVNQVFNDMNYVQLGKYLAEAMDF